MSMRLTEEQFMRRVTEWVNTYGKRIFGLCFTLCKNSHDADDLYQETWVKIIKSLDRYDEKRSFDSWAFKICVNSFRDMCRKRRKNAEVVGETEMQSFLESVPDIEETEKEGYSNLYMAIKHLKTNEQIAISLFYFKDMSGEDAAKSMGMSYNNFRVIVSRALKKLRKEMAQ